jgi:hypothetical protein
MNSPMSRRNFQPKMTIVLALFAVASLMPSQKVSALPLQPHYQTSRFGEGTTCSVNGLSYPVDDLGQIWAIGNGGRWIVVGHIVYGPYGPVAVRDDGTEYPAVCQ